jgi:hypothetical protein
VRKKTGLLATALMKAIWVTTQPVFADIEIPSQTLGWLDQAPDAKFSRNAWNEIANNNQAVIDVLKRAP